MGGGGTMGGAMGGGSNGRNYGRGRDYGRSYGRGEAMQKRRMLTNPSNHLHTTIMRIFSPAQNGPVSLHFQ